MKLAFPLLLLFAGLLSGCLQLPAGSGPSDAGGDSGAASEDGGKEDRGTNVDAGSQYWRLPITIPTGSVIGDHDNFPYLARLEFNESANQPEIKSKNQLRFTADDGTPLPFEVESLDLSGQLEAWVELPAIRETSELTLNLEIWDGAAPAGPEMWSDYAAVYHFNDTNLDEVADATANQNEGEPTDSVARAAGLIGAAGLFDGQSRVEVGVAESLEVQRFTLSAWVYGQESVTSGTVIGWPRPNSTLNNWHVFVAANRKLSLGVYASNEWRFLESSLEVPVDDWTHVAVTFDGQQLRPYVSGAHEGNSGTAFAPINYSDAEPVLIGADLDEGVHTGLFEGRLDEVRVAKVARSQSWIASEALNQEEAGSTVEVADFEGPFSGGD